MEYGEFGLVRESLAERTRLLRLAPQFVKPLELFIPIRHRFSGFRSAIGRIFGRDPQPLGDASGRVVGRGLWLVRLGLWLYDQYAKDSTLPRHRMVAADEGDGCFQDAPPVDASQYRWQCSCRKCRIWIGGPRLSRTNERDTVLEGKWGDRVVFGL